MATRVVLPPLSAGAETMGLSTCLEHLEQTQRVVTYYSDDLNKMARLLAN